MVFPGEKKAARFLINPAKGTTAGKKFRALGSFVPLRAHLWDTVLFQGQQAKNTTVLMSLTPIHPKGQGSKAGDRLTVTRVDAASMKHSAQEK